MDDGLRDRIAGLCGARVVQATPLSGGDVADAYRVDLVDGRRLFAKTHRDPPAGFFTTEARGLRWLAEANAALVAVVVAVSDESPACLVLEWIEVGGRPSAEGEAGFGRALAALHAAGAPGFGRDDRRTTGSLALPNDPCDSWVEFYADRRLRPLAGIAARRGALSDATVDRLLAVAAALAGYGAHDEPAARLHGDLWAGNRLIDTQGRSRLVDPAAHGGHREFDLAMMRLFGGFGEACFAAYAEAAPLAEGWERRVDLHQLAPLVVHAIKFGGGYRGAVDAALGRLGV